MAEAYVMSAMINRANSEVFYGDRFLVKQGYVAGGRSNFGWIYRCTEALPEEDILVETKGTLLFALTYFCSKGNSVHLYYGNGDSEKTEVT